MSSDTAAAPMAAGLASVAPAGGAAVECRDLVVRYGDLTAVDRLSLTAQAGEVLTVLGPNGAGKTSTVECLEGYRRPAGGTVRVLGLDPIGDHRALVSHIGVMLQRGGVYPMLDPRRALDLFASYYDRPERTEDLLALVGLKGVARTSWRHLSGGEQARLSLALALVGRPEVVFLDEPTAGVDPEGRLAVREVVAILRDRGACVLLTTHELGEAERLADRVVILHHGRVVAEGSPSALAAAGAGERVSFGAAPGLDVGSLGAVLGAAVVEESPGRYRVAVGPAVDASSLTAALTAWLVGQGVALTDLRVGRTLEEAYLDVVGSEGAAGSGAAGRGSAGSDRPGRE